MGAMRLSLLFCVATLAALNASPEHGKLVKHLLSKYDKLEGLPVDEEGKKLDVFQSIQLIKADVDDDDDTLNLVTYTVLSWKDYRLTWDPKEFGGIEKVHVPSELVWMPDVMLFNTIEAKIRQVTDVDCVVSSDGSVMFVPMSEYNAICNNTDSADDIFKCELKFGSWTYDGDHINIGVWEPKMDTGSFYHENKDWKLVGNVAEVKSVVYDCCPEAYPNIQYTLTFKSKKDNKSSSRSGWWD